MEKLRIWELMKNCCKIVNCIMICGYLILERKTGQQIQKGRGHCNVWNDKEAYRLDWKI